jgi:hypothetical protein
MPAFFKFLYYPIAFVFPALWLIWVFVTRSQQLRYPITSLLSATIAIVLLLLYQQYIAKDLYYVSTYHPEKQFTLFWENLLKFDNLFVKAFINPFLIKRFSNQTIACLSEYTFSLSVLFVLSSSILYYIRKYPKYIIKGNSISFMGLITIAVCLANVGPLLVLSLKYPQVVASWTPDRLWTYVQETRYYTITLLLVVYWVAIIAFSKSQISLYIRVPALLILFTSFMLSLVPWLNTTLKYPVHKPLENSLKYMEIDYSRPQVVNSLVKKEVNPVIFYSPSEQISLSQFFYLEGAAILEKNNLAEPLFASEPVTLLVEVPKKGSPEAEETLEFCKRYSSTIVATLPDLKSEIHRISLGKK